MRREKPALVLRHQCLETRDHLVLVEGNPARDLEVQDREGHLLQEEGNLHLDQEVPETVVTIPGQGLHLVQDLGVLETGGEALVQGIGVDQEVQETDIGLEVPLTEMGTGLHIEVTVQEEGHQVQGEAIQLTNQGDMTGDLLSDTEESLLVTLPVPATLRTEFPEAPDHHHLTTTTNLLMSGVSLISTGHHLNKGIYTLFCMNTIIEFLNI